MDKIPYRIPEYHKMVWKEANKEAKKIIFSDIRVILGELILAVVSGFATSRVLDSWSDAIAIPPIFQIIAIALGTLMGFIALYVFRLLTNGLLIMPAVFYRERETEAWKLTWNDIEIKPFPFPPSFGNAIGLEITSYKNRNIFGGTSREFSINVNKLLIEEFTKGISTEHPRRNLHFLATDLVRFHETTGIENQRDKGIKDNWVKHRVALVAQWDDKEAWIVTKDGNKDLLIEKEKPVGIIVTIDSSLEDVQMIGIAIYCTLRYIENKDGQMIVDLEITKRN